MRFFIIIYGSLLNRGPLSTQAYYEVSPYLSPVSIRYCTCIEYKYSILQSYTIVFHT